MNNKLTKLLTFLSLLLSINSISQIKGRIFEKETNLPLFYATIQIENLRIGTTTDMDGNFSVESPDSVVLHIGFLGLKEVMLYIPNSDTNIGNIYLSNENSDLSEIVVTASKITNTEQSILNIRSKSILLLDGISSEQLSKSGDSDAASAIKRVTGVSVQNGKYVFVRGLGDRYTKIILNGIDIPGLDPDRNTVQMDVLPSSIIENIIIKKSFIPSIPGDFAGGVVDIQTKQLYEPFFNISFNTSYNTLMHFQNDYLKYNGGNFDFLGFDDGTRSDPLNMNVNNPTPTGVYTIPQLKPNPTEDTKLFNNQLAPYEFMNPMDFGISVSKGNIIGKYSILSSLSYKSETKFFRNWEQNYYRKNLDTNITELRTERNQIGKLGVKNNVLSTMVGATYKSNKSIYGINLLYIQNGESKAGKFNQIDFISINNEQVKYNLEYTQRSISNLLLYGNHILKNDWYLDWKVSPTYSNIEDKDIRMTNYIVDRYNGGVKYYIDASEASFPKRIWRNLNEWNLSSKIDLSHNHSIYKYTSELKFGAYNVTKRRFYSILDYELRTFGNNPNLSGNGNELLNDNNIWSGGEWGTFIHGQYQANNTYSGSQNTMAIYVMEDVKINTNITVSAGIRIEKYTQWYTGQNQIANNSPNSPQAQIFNNRKVLDLLQILPSVILVYTNNNTNLRLNWSKTTTRPSFKEKSTAEIVDVLSGMSFIGNMELVQTDIHNLDIRYEKFYDSNQMYSIGAFYKYLKNPIEMISYQQASTSFQPRNVGNGTIVGMEFEGRLSIENFTVNTNASIINAKVTFDRRTGGDYDGKEGGLRSGESIGTYRDMQGQSPYIINNGITYTINGFEFGTYYNIQGPQLFSVGINLTPDVYSVPFHSLNANLFKKYNNFEFGMSVENLLNDSIETITKSYKSDDKVYSKIKPGVTIGFSINYKII